MWLNVKLSSPAVCTGDPAARVCCFGGQRSPENYTSTAAEVERDRAVTQQARDEQRCGWGTLTFLSAGQLLRSRSSDFRHLVFPRMAWILKLILWVTWSQQSCQEVLGCEEVREGWLTWLWAAVMATSLNSLLLLEFVLNVFTACWAAAWTSAESGLLSDQPPRRGTSSAHIRVLWWLFSNSFGKYASMTHDAINYMTPC